MEVNLIEKNAHFLFDKEGVIILTDVEKTDMLIIKTKNTMMPLSV